MEPYIGILVLGLYPAAIYLIPEPIAAREGWRAAKVAQLSIPLEAQLVRLPKSLKARSEKNGQYLLLLQLAIVLATTLGVVRAYSLVPAVLGTHIHDWAFALGIGLLAGALFFVVQSRLESYFPRLRESAADHPMLRGSLGRWVLIVILAPAAEFPRGLDFTTLGIVDWLDVGFGTEAGIPITDFVSVPINFGLYWGGATASPKK